MNSHDMSGTDRLAAYRRGRAPQGRARRRLLGAGTAIVAGAVIALVINGAATAGRSIQEEACCWEPCIPPSGSWSASWPW